jgi:phytoene synthase
MFDIDDAMAAVVARATEPAVAAIKLAWWRERLEELDEGEVPAEPRLQAAAARLLPCSVTGSMLAGLEDGWATLLEEEPDVERLLDRGARLFAIGGRLIGASDRLLEVAGRLYAYESYRFWGSGPLHWPMEEMYELSGYRFPKPLRPLTAFAALAARDARRRLPFEPEATPGRSWTLMRHRLTGRI